MTQAYANSCPERFRQAKAGLIPPEARYKKLGQFSGPAGTPKHLPKPSVTSNPVAGTGRHRLGRAGGFGNGVEAEAIALLAHRIDAAAFA